MDGIQPVIAAGSRELFAPIIEPARLVGGTESAQGSSFVHSLADAIRSTDDQERVADEKMAAVDSGSSDDLVGAMLASQDANLSFSLLMQVRNKIAGAMDELLKLQL